MAEQSGIKDFFISYNQADRAWAEWLARLLENAGYSTMLQDWDVYPGSNFVLGMEIAMRQTKQTIAVLSPDYFSSTIISLEWAATFRSVLEGQQGRLLPVLVRPYNVKELKGLLGPVTYIDLVGLDESQARRRLLAAFSPQRAKPQAPPPFPGSLGGRPSFPSALPSPHGPSPESMQFRAFHPKVAVAEKWQTLLVYAHAESALQAVRADAAKFQEEMGILPGETHSQPMEALLRGAEITIVPTCQGVVFNPEQQSFTWTEDWHQTRFRFWADRNLAELASNGEIVIYAGPLIVATLHIVFLFVLEEQNPLHPKKENSTEEAGYLYKQIFASYSHDDTSMVLACREVYKALGFNTLIDIDTLRAGQYWNEELMRMIEEADIFQLFWSAHSAKSRYVRREWKYALQHSKGNSFIRPVYWEKPLVSPPRELKKLHFAYIRPPKLSQLEDGQ